KRMLSPLPPSPPPKRSTSNLLSKDLTGKKSDISTLSSNQNSQKTINELLHVTKLSSTSPKNNQFCHQQSEGFEVPDDQPHNTFNLNSKDSGNFVVNNAASCSTDYINICVERVGNEGINLKFDIPCLADLKIDLKNFNISCYLGSKQKCTSEENSTISLPSQIDRIIEPDENPSRKKQKVVIESPSSGITIPEMNEFSYDFASIKRSNPDVSMITNNSDKHAFRNESSTSSSQIGENNCHILELDVTSKNESFANPLKNYKSSSSKSPSPLREKIKIPTSSLVKEEFLLRNEETSSYTSENPKTKNTLHINQTEAQFNSDQKASDSRYVSDVIGQVYDSTGEPEITPSPEPQKFNTKKSILKKRKKKHMSPSNKRLNGISVHNKKKILTKRAISAKKSHSSPLKNSLFESNDVDISVMDIHPFYTDASMKARNVQVNEEYSFDENTLYSQKSNKIVNFSVVDNDKLVSSETEINDDQNMESIKTDSFALFGPDVVSTNILLSPVEEKDQYVNSKKEEPSLSKRQHEDSSVEIGVEQSLSSSSQSDLEKKEVNAIENSQLILNVGQNIENWLGNVAVSNLGVETEVEERTQGTFSRPSGKKQDFSLSETEIEKEKKILKKSFKNSCISVAEQSESMNGDPKHFTDPISEIDSDYEPTMVIAEDDEVSHSSYDSNVEDSVRTAGNPACNDSLNETSSEEEYENQEESSEEIKYTKISIPEIIKQVFDKVEKTIAPACFKDCVKNLVKALIDPNNAKNCQELIYYLISHLCVSRKNPMQSFNLRNNPEVLLPLTEKSFVTALFFIAFENKPHLTGLLTSTVNTLYHIILLKTQYHINGLSSLCRVLTVMCKLLKDIRKIKILCYDIFKHNHKYAPYLLGSIISIWPEALAMSSDSTEEERLFIRAIAYGCEQKPRTLTDTHWKNCNCVLRVYFNIEVLHYNANDVAIHIMNKIISKCLSEPIEDDFLLKGPLIIYSRIKGRDWTLKFLLEKLILPSLTSFCEEANENGFKFLTDLIADLCFVFEESVSQKLLLEYATSSKEVEFIYCYGGMSLLKLVCLKKELFPDVLKQWSIDYTNDPRTDICVRYFYWRMILDSDLYLEEMCLNNI
ncbi:uncharacterized protein NPIL_178471, partial [Nephila pilipes]